MSDATPLLADEIRAVKDAFAALNRNDVAGVVKDFDPQIVRVEPPGFATADTYRGIDALTPHLSRARGTWAEGTCEPLRFIVAGDRIVVPVHVRVRLKGKADWIDAETADVFTFRDGKVVDWRTFLEERHAREWAGIT